MKIVYNDYIPFKNFEAINLFGVMFVRRGYHPSQTTLNHEAIHTAQMKEMGYVFFYLWYFIEWFIRLTIDLNAYANLSFEREAYQNQGNPEFLKERKHFNWIKYIWQK